MITFFWIVVGFWISVALVCGVLGLICKILTPFLPKPKVTERKPVVDPLAPPNSIKIAPGRYRVKADI